MVLSSLLTGKSLDVYARLPDEEATDYDKIKIALQKRYNLTEEGFRLKFRKSTPEEDENPAQFITRIGKHLDKWTDLGGATDSKMLKTLLIKEQFLNMCNKHLAIHLKEKPFVNMQEMCDRAERYLESHKQKLANDNEQKAEETNGLDTDSHTEKRQSYTEQRQKQSYTEQRQMKNCYNCGKLGHVRSNCTNKGGGNEQECDKCKMFSHLAETCRNTSEFDGIMRTRRLRHGKLYKRQNQCKDTNLGMHKTPEEGDTRNKLEIMKGKINGHMGNTLRDTGCTVICVNKKFVKQKQLTGKYQTCTMMDGTKRRFEIAAVDLDTPYIRQNQIRVLCVDNLEYDIVVGDVPQARCRCNPDPNWKSINKTNTYQ